MIDVAENLKLRTEAFQTLSANKETNRTRRAEKRSESNEIKPEFTKFFLFQSGF